MRITRLAVNDIAEVSAEGLRLECRDHKCFMMATSATRVGCVTFVREMRILPICFHRYTGNLASKIFFLYMYLYFRLYHIHSSCLVYKCP